MDRSEDLFKRITESGEEAIDDFISTRASEELFLDFKRSSDNGTGNHLSQGDRNNLAKAISGFGNSEGGVIVWGVDCSSDDVGADVANAKVPITDAARFCSWLEGAISGCTIPPHGGVRNRPVTIGQGGDGYVITHIPKSDLAPHQVVGKTQYYMRAGSSFVPVPHRVLAGMFGVHPQPTLKLLLVTGSPKVYRGAVTLEYGIMLRNDGPGIAKDLFVTLWLTGIKGGTEMSVERPSSDSWRGVASFGTHLSFISAPDFRLPPDSQSQPTLLSIILQPPFEGALKLTATAGCEGTPIRRFESLTDASVVEAIYDELIAANKDGSSMTKEALSEYPGRLVDFELGDSP